MLTLFEIAKKIRRAHPKKKWQDCVKAAAKEMKSKPVKKSVGSVRKPVVSKKKVVKKTTKTERYTIAGFKLWKWLVKLNRGTFEVTAGSAAEARKNASVKVKAHNDFNKQKGIKEPALKLVSIKKIEPKS